MNVQKATGLTRAEALKRRSMYGLNTVTPPVNCPSWVCCLLPCILRTESMRLFHLTLPQEATVLRDGRQFRMDAISLVYGDIVYLKVGDKVPADLRIIECSSDCKMDLSVFLTEETLVHGSIECTDAENQLRSANMAFMASRVIEGTAIGVVVALGDETIWGQVVSSGQWPLTNRREAMELDRLV